MVSWLPAWQRKGLTGKRELSNQKLELKEAFVICFDHWLVDAFAASPESCHVDTLWPTHHAQALVTITLTVEAYVRIEK